MIKANKIFKISIKSEIDEDNDSLEHPIYNDFSNFLEPIDHRYIGFEDKKTIFIRLLDHKVKMFCYTLSKYDIEFDIDDVTSEVITGEISKKYPSVENLTPGLFRNFRYDNTSIDDILEKINKSGIDSLDKIDKYILSKQ